MRRLDDNLVCNGTTIGSQHSTLSSGITTGCSGTKAERATKLCSNAYKGKKEALILSDLSLNRWLDDDAAIQQGANRVSCQVTVVVEVTDIDVSSTGSHNFDGDLTLGTLSRSQLVFTSGSHNLWCFDQHRECLTAHSSQQISITMKLSQGVGHLPFHQPTARTSVVWTGLLG